MTIKVRARVSLPMPEKNAAGYLRKPRRDAKQKRLRIVEVECPGLWADAETRGRVKAAVAMEIPGCQLEGYQLIQEINDGH